MIPHRAAANESRSSAITCSGVKWCRNSDETMKSTLPDGKTNTVTFRAGEATWHNADTHAVENVGKNEIHALDIELKK